MNSFRSFLYALARGLGDVNAVRQSAKKNSLRPIARRVGRRIVGRIAGCALGRIFR